MNLLTEGIKKQAQELIEQAYQRGFKAGRVDNQTFHESICNGCKKGFEDREMELIEQGRNEAWEAAKKLVSAGYKECNEILGDGVLAIETIDEIFLRCTASEAIEKLKDYDDQKKKESKFHVGDEVIYGDIKWIVVREEYAVGTNIPVIMVNLFREGGFGASAKVSEIKKTGRTFPQIAEVFQKMKEDAE